MTTKSPNTGATLTYALLNNPLSGQQLQCPLSDSNDWHRLGPSDPEIVNCLNRISGPWTLQKVIFNLIPGIHDVFFIHPQHYVSPSNVQALTATGGGAAHLRSCPLGLDRQRICETVN
jgi:hypothetical protein